MRDDRAGTGIGAEPEALLDEANRLIAGWLSSLEESGDRLLESCSRAKLAAAVTQFIDYARRGEVSPGAPSVLSGAALEAAAQSLRHRLTAAPSHPRSSLGATKLLLRACRGMLQTARGPGDDPKRTESLTAVLAAAAARTQRATSPGNVKRTAVAAAVQLCAAKSAVWWDQQDPHVLSAGRCQGIRLAGDARSVSLPASFWKTGLIREGVAALPAMQDGQRDLFAAVGAANGVIVRAGGGGHWVGALSVHDGRFDPERIDLLVALSQQAAATCRALELAADKRQLTEVQQRSISELGFALSSALSAEELLELTSRSAADLVQADACLVYLGEPEGDFVLRATTDPDLVASEDCADTMRSFAEQVRAQPLGKPLWRTGTGGRGVAQAVREAGYQSMLGTALSIRGDPLGALLLLSRKPKAFTATQREILVSFAAQAAVGIENIQLVEDMQRRLLEMADLTWVSTRVTSTMEVERIAATVADAASKAVDAPRIALFLTDEQGEFIPIPGGQRGIPEATTQSLPSTGHVGYEALAVGVPQTIIDSQRENREDDALIQWLGTRSLLCVPMVAQQGVQGILAVGDVRPRDFPSHALALLSAYANQTALALQSAMLYQDVVRHLKELENLFGVTQTLASSLELTQTLDRVLSAAAELLGSPVGTLMLMDADTNELTIKAARGIHPDHGFYRPLAVGEGLAGRAVQSGTALMSADIRRDGRFSDRAFAREGDLQAAIAVPLVTRGRTVGVLNLYRKSQREFDENDRRLATALANAAAVAIENARLYEETQERAQFLTAMVSEINHRVRNTLQAVAGLLRMEMEQEPPRPIEEVLRRGIARLQSVAVVHDMLQARDLRFVDIKQAARRIVQLTAQSAAPGNAIQTRIVGARVMLPSQQATNVAMILSELVDNAVRHGLPNAEDPRVSVSLAEGGGNIVIEVKDNGEGFPKGFNLDADARLGLKVVRGLVEEELGGFLDVESNNGVTARAKFPRRR